MESFSEHLASVEPLLQRWGYAAVFACVFVEGVGIPAPGQTLLLAGALLAGRGELSFAGVLATTFVAATLGNALGFWVGRRGGRALLLRLARADRLERIEALFRRSGGVWVLLGRFVDGARQLNGLAAGAFEMQTRRFLGWNLAGAALWTGFWGGGAWLFGRDLHAIAAFLQRGRPWLLATAAITVVGLAIWLVRRRAGATPPANASSTG